MGKKQKSNQQEKTSAKKARQDEQIVFQAKVRIRNEKRESSRPTTEQFMQAIALGMKQCPDTLSDKSGITVPVLSKLQSGKFAPSIDQMKQVIGAVNEMHLTASL